MALGTAGATWRVKVGDAETTATFEPALTSTGTLFVCAHGAGGHMADQGMLALAEHLRRRGLDVLRFNFLYREQGSRRPDPMPRLKECIVAVAARAREEIAPPTLVLGGRSMGGRAASLLAADPFRCDGLILLAYPLHRAGEPEKLRAAHLARIEVPVLCINGTGDALCRRDLMERAISGLADRWTMHWVEGADHGFHVPRGAGRSDRDVLNEIGDACGAWVARVRPRTEGSEAMD